jgi:hypothetical protein
MQLAESFRSEHPSDYSALHSALDEAPRRGPFIQPRSQWAKYTKRGCFDRKRGEVCAFDKPTKGDFLLVIPVESKCGDSQSYPQALKALPMCARCTSLPQRNTASNEVNRPIAGHKTPFAILAHLLFRLPTATPYDLAQTTPRAMPSGRGGTLCLRSRPWTA